jgi:hypothetical protein
MVALHGRDDQLLEQGRFVRLLRQANDAEMADVRKLSDTEYEVSPHRLDATAAAARRETPPPADLVALSAALGDEIPMVPAVVVASPPADTPAPANGARAGIRFRRGSRSPSIGTQIPLIGVVQMEPVEPVVLPQLPAGDDEAPKAAKGRGRGRARARKPAAAATEAASVPAPGPDPAAAPAARKRTRTRAKKKAE